MRIWPGRRRSSASTVPGNEARGRKQRKPTLEDLEGRQLLSDGIVAKSTIQLAARPGGRPRAPAVTLSILAPPDADGGVVVQGKTKPKAKVKLELAADDSL